MNPIAACCSMVLLLMGPISFCYGQQGLADIIERCEKSVVRISVESTKGESLGSGFVIASDGVIVTNHHVIAGAARATATFPNGKSYPVTGTKHLDRQRDIAIIKIETIDLPVLSFAQGTVRKGEQVAALGSPIGLSFTATNGIVSGIRSSAEMSSELGEDQLAGTWIQVDTPISPGNSGGPLINSRGEVVAMSTLASTGVAQNLNFGISAADIEQAIASSSSAFVKPLAESTANLRSKPKNDPSEKGIRARTVPRPSIEAYINDGKQGTKSVEKSIRTQMTRQSNELKAIKLGEISNRPLATANGSLDMERVTTNKGAKWYFRSESVKQREVTRQESRIRELASVLDQLSSTNEEEALLALSCYAGNPVDLRRTGSVGFLMGALAIAPLNDTDVVGAYDSRPILLKLESSASVVPGQEIEAVPVYVTQSETITSGSRTMTVTVLQQVSREEIQEVLKESRNTPSNPSDSADRPGSKSSNGARDSGVAGGGTKSLDDPAGLFAPKAKTESSSYRTWYNREGKSVEGLLLKQTTKEITLLLRNGKQAIVPISNLSEADQKYLRQ